MGLLDFLKGNKKQDTPKAQGAEEQRYTFVVQDIFTIKGQGSVVVGVARSNSIHVGDSVYIIKRNKRFLEAVVTAIEVPGTRMEEAPPDFNVALMFRDLPSDQLEKGDVISNQRPSFSYGDSQENPRLRGLLAERGSTLLPELEGYIQEETDLYTREEAACAEGDKKGGAELPR